MQQNHLTSPLHILINPCIPTLDAQLYLTPPNSPAPANNYQYHTTYPICKPRKKFMRFSFRPRLLLLHPSISPPAATVFRLFFPLFYVFVCVSYHTPTPKTAARLCRDWLTRTWALPPEMCQTLVSGGKRRAGMVSWNLVFFK